MKFFLSLSCLLALLLVGAQAQAPAPAPGCQTVYQYVQSNSDLSILFEALEFDDLEPYLNTPDLYYTVFAPTNEAFDNAFQMLDANLTEILYSGHLDSILQYHFLAKPYLGSQLDRLETIPTVLTNQTLTFTAMQPDGVMVDGYASNATVVESNIRTCNSIVHTINAVLLPNFQEEGLAASI